MAISFSRPDPTSPASVRDANFPTARRGFDQQEVRDFLRMVAAELARMQERERYLDQEIRSMRHQRPAPGLPSELDDETLARLVGEETTRIVQTARESASAIRAKATEAAERMLREARDEAQRLREEAELDASRRRKDADQDAEAELEMAKQQGREMVEEARAYRERALGELARRRDLAREQIDQLIHGRDRLVQAFERARLVAADVVDELAPLGELTEYVNLSPTTGPIPVMVPASRLGETSSISDDALALKASSDPDDPALDPPPPSEATKAIDRTLAAGPSPPGPPTEAAETEADDTAEPEDATEAATVTEQQEGSDEPAVDEPAGEPGEAATTPLSGATVLPFPDRRSDEAEVEVEVQVTDDGGEVEGEDTAVDEVVDDDDITANDVDSLFARLRAQREDTAPEEESSDATSDQVAEPSPFGRRDESLTPLIVSSARKLKRVLADEQNDVLDRLRAADAVRSIDDVLPVEGEHGSRYFDPISAELLAAAEAGAESLGGARLDIGDGGVLAAVREALTENLVEPLRDRLADRVADGDGDNAQITKSVRAVYREWKTKHIDDHLDDLLRLAYGRGAFAALGEGEQCRWMFDPAVGPCSDCEDNSLQGAVTVGTAFPTGHIAAPAHAGCRCLLARA